jgi:hypothetical protein
MSCNAMHPMQDYFWKGFYMQGTSICNLYALLCWQHFYSYKMWVLQRGKGGDDAGWGDTILTWPKTEENSFGQFSCYKWTAKI